MAMFESLTEKLNRVFYKLSSRGKLSEKDVDDALREVRLALLEADVNFKVVKDFIRRVRERSVGEEVRQSLTPAQQIIKIVNDELIVTLGGTQSQLVAGAHPPHVVMLVGLQGGGKTTTAAKLALHLRHAGQRPLLVAASRKGFIGSALSVDGREPPPDERLEGTAAVVAHNIAHGVDFVRVHDVRAMAQVARVADAIVRGRTQST